jgi:hypothetical protein
VNFYAEDFFVIWNHYGQNYSLYIHISPAKRAKEREYGFFGGKAEVV